MPILSAVPRIPANSVAETAAWFATHLGFRTEFLHPPEQPVYAGVARDKAELHIFPMDIDPKESDFMVYLRVTGIEELYEEFKGRGLIHPNGPLQSKPWGMREFSVLDPNGTLLTFGEPAKP
ncbi:MAG: VOC family protein [Bryobacteraceae bacterium]|nr:VOC family protein [Bryobacteraceae bacterium]